MILSGKNEENTSMEKAKQYLIALLLGVFLTTTVLSGCGQSKKEVSQKDNHLTVYLWENRLMKNIAPYIQKQFPDQDIEFITGNNNTDLYSYFEEHGELPDIITVRRFSEADAQDLQPYLMDFCSYDVVSKYSHRHSLPTRHCLISMGSRFRKIIRNMHRLARNFMIMV